jgi:division protein CdvB (Snf7/Vps24/ESCRT-III family)
LPNKFKWEQTESPEPLNRKVKGAFHPTQSLRPRLQLAINRIEAQAQRLDQTSRKLSERDKALFAKIVEAYQKHDVEHANVFSSELAEIRKTEKTVMHARLALDQMTLRLKTVSELGDMVGALAPIVGVLGSIRTAIVGVLPDAGKELEQIGTMLNGIIMDAGQSSGLTLNFGEASEDAKGILAEAATVVEQRMKDKFPDLPGAVPTGTDKTQGKT